MFYKIFPNKNISKLHYTHLHIIYTENSTPFEEVLTRDEICDALRDLVPCVQFKTREKHPWRSVNFSRVAGFSLQLY